MMAEMQIELVEPCEELREGYIEYVEEFRAAGEKVVGQWGDVDEDFTAFVQRLRDYAHGMNLPDEWVPATTFWLVCGGRVLGTADLRHRLTEALKDVGGHVGYGIRPSERGKGYATLMLELVLVKAKQLGLGRVLVTCDKDNPASARVIQKNGGKLDSETISKQSGKMKQRYWIELRGKRQRHKGTK